jgi:hypothetical protein
MTSNDAERLWPCIVALAAALMAALWAPGFARAESATAEPGLHRDVTFDHYPELATSLVVTQRLLGPKAHREFQGRITTLGQTPRPQFFDPADERFAVYVPKRKPAGGYGLVVFIAPWPEAALPPGWASVLDEYGAILVTAARSGNEESVYLRRIPLALTAAWNVAQAYDVDRSRIYAAGFSGGSRAAERMALEYPDLFSGAILNAGADPIGEAHTPIPRAELLERFQTASRIVLVTGQLDQANVTMDAAARGSLRDWCVAHVRQITMPRTGHQPATPEALADAFRAMGGGDDARVTARSQRCRADLAARLATDVARVRTLRDPSAVAAETDKLENRYGWLAADALAGLAK